MPRRGRRGRRSGENMRETAFAGMADLYGVLNGIWIILLIPVLALAVVAMANLDLAQAAVDRMNAQLQEQQARLAVAIEDFDGGAMSRVNAVSAVLGGLMADFNLAIGMQPIKIRSDRASYKVVVEDPRGNTITSEYSDSRLFRYRGTDWTSRDGQQLFVQDEGITGTRRAVSGRYKVSLQYRKGSGTDSLRFYTVTKRGRSVRSSIRTVSMRNTHYLEEPLKITILTFRVNSNGHATDVRYH